VVVVVVVVVRVHSVARSKMTSLHFPIYESTRPTIKSFVEHMGYHTSLLHRLPALLPAIVLAIVLAIVALALLGI
jgi:hypothetical protein